ncbi:MAG TPA: VOC family protein [Mycobacteriales bacterium]|jgi:predicted enzyme related to lactoylglutathione lyase|nr:VOC family protein [Mycobacteriales bacterium]
MADPLEILRRPIVALDPDPSFATRLRAQVERALDEGEPMSSTSPVSPVTAASTAADGDIAFFSLHVPSAERAREFYRELLGWQFGDSLELGRYDQVVNLSLPCGVWDGGGVPGVPNPGVHLVHHVADIEAAVARVRELGGTAEDPYSTPYGLRTRCLDDQGNGFSLVQEAVRRPAPAEHGELPGDLAYVTVSPGDEQRAAAFYSGLFGWGFHPGNVERGLQVEGMHPGGGFWGGTGRQNVMLMYRVADVAAAAAKVRELGGQATDPVQMPYGITSDCVDDQGMAFYLGEL